MCPAACWTKPSLTLSEGETCRKPSNARLKNGNAACAPWIGSPPIYPGTSNSRLFNFRPPRGAPCPRPTVSGSKPVTPKRWMPVWRRCKRSPPAMAATCMPRLRPPAALDPQPDNIFLITDGLPTQGATPSKEYNVTPEQRLKLFQNAMSVVNLSIPINVILFPMEGDPFASPSFWRLAQITGGAFLSPARDWP